MKKKKNFMDFVPCCNPVYTWDADKKGIVTVHVVNKGFYNWMAQKLFKRPHVSHIKLDEYGSFVWHFLILRRQRRNRTKYRSP